jgi:photosystem II stability/assembly factor-like uncharacterized protein
MKKFTVFILALHFFLIVHCTLVIDNCMCQWVAQTLPVNPELIYCVKFYNRNTGYMTTGNVSSSYTPQILKTTNEGNNWVVIRDNMRIYDFQVLDSVTVYGNGRTPGNDMIYRTFNGGTSWDSVSITSLTYHSVYFFNKDTGYVSGSDGSWGNLWKTFNGGITLNQIFVSDNPSFGYSIFIFKEKINGEYYGYSTSFGYIYKTTNSGYNWIQLGGGLYTSIGDYFFLNKDTGWVSNITNMDVAVIQHTTNGGTNWINQFTTPTGHYPGGLYFSSYNKGWAGSSDGYFIFITTNGGQVWCRQNTPYYRTPGIFFLDSLTGWCYSYQLAHTTNGGGIILQITNNKEQIIKEYKLYQNYPNPFNSQTNIEYSIHKKSTIGIVIYDISGRSVYDLTSNNNEPGNYKVRLDFAPLNLPSGVYFYKLIVINENGSYLYSEVKKMVYLK